jgi:hypothetical protein
VTPDAGGRRRGEIAPGPSPRLEPPEERGALTVGDHAGGHRGGELRLGDLACDPAQAGHRHTAVGGDLGEGSGAEPALELVGGQAQGTRDAGVEGAAHAPQATCSESAGGRHTGTLTGMCLDAVKRS